MTNPGAGNGCHSKGVKGYYRELFSDALLLPWALCSSWNGNKSTAWFTKDVPHLLEQFSRGVRLWKDFKSLQRFSVVKPVVIQQTPDE